MCYCLKCHKNRNDQNIYYRGTPPQEYEIPVDFAGFAVRLSHQNTCVIQQKEIFKNWHNSFHGTTVENLNKISKCGMKLYRQGDTTSNGDVVEIR